MVWSASQSASIAPPIVHDSYFAELFARRAESDPLELEGFAPHNRRA
jgi:hypothetical protein